MRGVVTSFGSIGDIHPLVALAHELRKAGHDLTFALAPSFAAWVKRYGFACVNMGADLSEMQRNIMQAMSQEDFSFAAMQSLLDPYIQDMPGMFEVLEDTCKDADFLISVSTFPVARMVYEATNIPFICVDLESVQGGPNSFTAPLEHQVAALINPFRQRLQLPPIEYPLSLDGYSPDLTLFATSRQIMSPSKTWPANAHITGFFFLDEDDWVPDQSLTDFLAGGEPPLMINFGSTAHADTPGLAKLVFESIERTGSRAIIQQGWTSLAGDGPLPANLHAVGFVSHSWLLPRVSCLVCHGGTQTSASAFRHGVPLICVPHTWEHLPSTLFVKGFGAGLVVPYHQLSVDSLSAAVREITGNPSYRQSAGTLKEKIRTEKGLERAVELVNVFLASVYE